MSQFRFLNHVVVFIAIIIQVQIGLSASVTINTSGNWTASAPSLSNGDALFFSGSNGTSINNFASANLTSISGLTFNPTVTGNYSVNANGLSIGNPSVTTGATYQSIVSTILQTLQTAVDGNLTISNTGYVANSSNYTHSVGNFTISNNALLIVDGSSNTIFSGNSTSGSNSTNLAKIGSGNLTIAGDLTVARIAISGGAISVPTGGYLHNPSFEFGDNNTIGVGINGNGTLNLDGGYIQIRDLGISYNGTGVVNVNSGTLNVRNDLGIGNGGTGSLNLTGGNIIIGDDLYIGDGQGLGNGTMGLVNISAGSIAVEKRLVIGSYAGSGTLNQSGGNITLIHDDYDPNDLESTSSSLGGNYQTTGTANISGGTLTSNRTLYIGYFGTGVLNITSTGVVDVGTNAIYLAKMAGSNGTLNLGNGANAGTLIASSVIGGEGVAVVNFNHSGSYTFSSNLTGSLSVNKFGNGTTILIGDNTYTGGTTINSGTLQIGNGTTSTAGSIVGDIAIGSGAVVTVNRTGTMNYSGNATGAGSVTLSLGSSGTLVLTGDNTYTGGTTINSGTLQIGNGTTSTAGSIVGDIAIGSGAVVSVNRTGTMNYSGNVTGAGSVTLSLGSNGTLALTGTNSYFGGTTLNSGTIYAESARSLGNGSVTITNNAALGIGAIKYTGLNSTSSTNLALQVNGNFTWASPNSTIVMGEGAKLEVTGALLNGGVSGNRTFDLNKIGTGLGNYTIATFGSSDFAVGNFLAKIGSDLTGSGFSMNGTALTYTISSIPTYVGGTSTTIDNSIPSFAYFNAAANAVMSVSGNQTLNALGFSNNGSLTLSPGKTLTIASGNISVDAGSASIYNGTVKTSGDFYKSGSGKLDVRSDMVVSGNATVGAGVLTVNGNLTAAGPAGIVVNSGSMLGGNATFFGNLTVSGTLAPGNSPGTQDIIGDLAINGGANAIIDIESSSRFDRINVSGSATIAGTLTANFSSDITYGSFRFINAAGGITGSFTNTEIKRMNVSSSIVAPTKTTVARTVYEHPSARLSYLNSGTLLVAPVSYKSVAATQNQKNVAGVLDSFTDTASTGADQEVVSIALDGLTAGEYPAAFNQIAPGFYESLANISIERAFNQTQLLSQRISSLRLGAASFQAMGGINQPLRYDKNGKNVAEANAAKPIVTSSTNANWSLWVLGTGMFSRSTNLSNLQNYKNNAGGFLVGSDYRWSEQFVTGLYSGYDYSQAKYAGGGSTKGNSFSFGSYASYAKNGYYADGVVGGGYTGFQTKRKINFATIDRTAKANPNSGHLTTGINGGKDFKMGHLAMGPVAGAQYTYTGIGSFKESGADSLNLAIGQQNAHSLRSTLGGRVAYTWELNQKIALIPELRMGWQHEFLNNPRNINAKLDGASGDAFNHETADPSRNSVFSAAGVTTQFGQNLSGSLFYNVNFDGQSFLNNIVSTGLNVAF